MLKSQWEIRIGTSAAEDVDRKIRLTCREGTQLHLQ